MKLNNRQKGIVLLIVLIEILAVMSASAAIQATDVELRGWTATSCPCSWNATNFGGFWYDVDADLKTESLSLSANIVGGVDRTIDPNALWYNTTKVSKSLKVYENGHSSIELSNLFLGGNYNLVGWQGKPYVAVKDKANKLSKLVIEQGNKTSDKKILTVGETWDVGDGWTLKAQGINSAASPMQVNLILSKDGVEKDNTAIEVNSVYVYYEDIAGELEVPLFVTYIDSIYSDASTSMVQLRYTWAISTNITEIKVADKLGSMEVVTADSMGIILKNKDTSITLAQGSTIDIIGDIKFNVADSTTLRFYPSVTITEPGVYEVRGGIATESASWNAVNFAGFWYDLKDDLMTEILSMTSPILGRTIYEDSLWYNTTKAHRTLKVYANGLINSEISMLFSGGAYSIVGWQGQQYVAVNDQANKLSKLLIEQGNKSSDKKTLTVGEIWDIGDGWTLKAQSIDAKAIPRQVWLVLSKDGVTKDEKVLAQGQIYVYLDDIAGEFDVPLFVTYVDSIFAGATTDMIQLRYTWAISTNVTEIKIGDKFGNMEVVTSTSSVISLKNKDITITLTRGGIIDIMDEIKFRVADSPSIRYYPMVEYEITGATTPSSGGGGGSGVTSYDTLAFESNTWNLVSVPKTLENSSLDVAFVNLSLDTNNVKWQFNGMWNHPFEIEPLIGYWVYNNASSSVSQKLDYKNMSGPNVPPSINLMSGWNLIGHTSTSSTQVSSALVSIDGKYSHLLSYSPNDGWKMYIVGNPSLQQFTTFEPGNGYWIFMTQDATYAAVEV